MRSTERPPLCLPTSSGHLGNPALYTFTVLDPKPTRTEDRQEPYLNMQWRNICQSEPSYFVENGHIVCFCLQPLSHIFTTIELLTTCKSATNWWLSQSSVNKIPLGLRSSEIKKDLKREALLLWSQWCQLRWAEQAAWSAPVGVVCGHIPLGGSLGLTQDTMEGQYFPAGFGTSRNPSTDLEFKALEKEVWYDLFSILQLPPWPGDTVQ